MVASEYIFLLLHYYSVLNMAEGQIGLQEFKNFPV